MSIKMSNLTRYCGVNLTQFNLTFRELYEIEDICDELHRLAGRLRRLYTKQCNDSQYGAADEQKVGALQDKVEACASKLQPYFSNCFNFEVEHQLDPRGAAVIIRYTDRYNVPHEFRF